MHKMEFSERLLAYGTIVKSGFCTQCGTAYVKLSCSDAWVAGNGETECGQPVGLCAGKEKHCSQIVRFETMCGRIKTVTSCGGAIWDEEKLDSGYDPLKIHLGY